jgi:hypothetical protein
MLVHQLQPTEKGLPLEIIAFVKGTDALSFEELQSDLFDHLLAVLPEFGLSIFQNPIGSYGIEPNTGNKEKMPEKSKDRFGKLP